MAETLITDQRSETASYKILRRLGKGGMAEVFLARQEGLAGFRRLTVIKKLLPQFSQVPEVAEMLLDEARIAAQLTHPNIVQIYELGKDADSYFIAMEYVDGCDLATLARIERHRQSRVPLRLTLRVVSEASMGLDYAHRQTGLDGRPLNIVHRDVSPHNLMCSREGAVKVTDFGIAKAVGKALVTQVGVVKGKVQYMSPEQYVGGDVDHRSDIFSLGVVLYQLTTGKLPRVAKDGNLAMRRVIEGQIPRPSELRTDYPDELERIVMRALAHNPEERYPDAASLREDLLDFARENDLLAFPKELGDYINAQVPPIPLVVREQSVAQSPSRAASTPSLTPPFTDPAASVDKAALPSVMVEGEESDTEAPSGTEVASPQGAKRRTQSTADAEAMGPTDIPINASDPAVLPDERLTPVIDRRAGSRLVVPSEVEAAPHRHGEGPARPRELILPRPAEPSHSRPPRLHVGGPDLPGRSTPQAMVPRERKLEPAAEHAGQDALSPQGSSQPTPVPTSTATAPAVAPARPRAGTRTWLTCAIAVVVAGCIGALVYLFILQRRPPTTRPEPTPTASPLGAGVINVLANPANSSVSVDGARRCPSTPCQIGGLPLGRELVLTVRSDGYNLWMQRLVLTPSEPKLLLRTDLTPLTGQRTVSPPKNGQGRPSSPATRPASPRKGRPKGAAARQATGAKSQGGLVVTDIQPDRSLLAVDVRPWAEVWANGKKVGHTPMQVSMQPGTYTVQLKNPELKFEKTFKVKAQMGKKVKINLAIQPPGQPSEPPQR